MNRTEIARELALELGFDAVGVAPLRPPRAADRFRTWLERGHHAGMDWLVRNRDRIVDPGRILAGGRSVLVVALGHARKPVELEGGGRVARYAAGRDYHNALGKLLRKLGRRLEAAGIAGVRRSIVDAGPLLERSHAAEAGLGFESKAANLLHATWGPWFFLGELLLEAELEPTAGPAPGSCGTCTACLDACPTGAIREPGVVDANLCISYHTIENRGRIPRALRARLGGWVFGCDVCSEVCPWGTGAPDASARLGLHAAVERGSLVDWLGTDRERFADEFRGSPLQRPRRDGLARNAALALAAAPSERGRDALLAALAGDPAEGVREAAGWSLAHAFGSEPGVRAALARAATADPAPGARRSLAELLDGAP